MPPTAAMEISANWVIGADLAEDGDGVVAAGEVGEVDDDVFVVGVGVDGVDHVVE